MPAPKGNKNGRGQKGRSGRKSYFQEKADAQFLIDFFYKQHTKEEIKAAIDSGKFSVSERMLLQAMEGNERMVTEVFKKLFPDKLEVDDKSMKLDV